MSRIVAWFDLAHQLLALKIFVLKRHTETIASIRNTIEKKLLLVHLLNGPDVTRELTIKFADKAKHD